MTGESLIMQVYVVSMTAEQLTSDDKVGYVPHGDLHNAELYEIEIFDVGYMEFNLSTRLTLNILMKLTRGFV